MTSLSGTSKSNDTFSVDNSGITDALDLIEESKATLQNLHDEQFKQEEKQAEKYKSTIETINTAFGEIPEDEEPLDDENFNIVVNALVTDGDDSDTLTTDVTNHLRSIILATIGLDEDTDLASLSEVDAEKFKDILAQIILDNGGKDGVLSVEEFEVFIVQYGFDTEEFAVEQTIPTNAPKESDNTSTDDKNT